MALELSPWDSYVRSSSWNCRVVEVGEGCKFWGWGEKRASVRHRLGKSQCWKTFVSACVRMFVPLCACAFEKVIEGADSIYWGTRGHRCKERKCTFSISQGGGWVVETVGEMQVVLNVLVSSEADKSNQVLSGSATMSWLFEPSGPCSSVEDFL